MGLKSLGSIRCLFIVANSATGRERVTTGCSGAREEMETAKVVSEAEELPKAIVRRVVKEKLSQCSDAGDISLHKDALLAFAESARIFIHYLSATYSSLFDFIIGLV